jgi:hypothetical protein
VQLSVTTFRSLRLAAVVLAASGVWACSSDDSAPGAGTGGGGTGGNNQTGGSAGGETGGSGVGGSTPDAATGSGGASDSGPTEGGSNCATGDLLCDPQQMFPPKLSDTKLFPSAPDLTKHSDRLRAYKPLPELWSDGLHKQRWILLPVGTKVDNTTSNNWVFPKGTLMVKTFADDGTSGDHLVETRLLRKTDDTFYEFAVYKWNDAQTDADLVDNSGKQRVPVQVTLGGQTFTHDLPSQTDCNACHSSNAKKNQGNAAAVIGFDEIRIASTPDQLNSFADLFMMPPPTNPATITDADPTLQQVKRFVFGNCVHCHNNNDSPVDFSPDVWVQNTVCQVTDGHVMPPAGWYRINPKKPDMSVAYVQAMAVKPGTVLPDPSLRPMPPVGVTVPLMTELDNMKKWINSLPACK